MYLIKLHFQWFRVLSLLLFCLLWPPSNKCWHVNIIIYSYWFYLKSILDFVSLISFGIQFWLEVMLGGYLVWQVTTYNHQFQF